MRFTEDLYHLSESEYAWEILYAYINPEVSEPYAGKTLVAKIPPGTRIWKEEGNCLRAINKLHKQKSIQDEKSIQEMDIRKAERNKKATGNSPGTGRRVHGRKDKNLPVL